MTISTLGDVLRPASNGDVAVDIPGGPTLDYARLDDEVERVAGRLAAAGISRGTTVSIILPNGLEFIVAFLAVARCGAVAAPLNSAYTVDEFKFYMEDASSGLAILPAGSHPGREAATQLGVPCIDVSLDGADVELTRDGRVLTASADPVPPSPGDPALFLHTSGTTSRPKGVPLTHANLMSSLGNISSTYGLTPEDSSLIVMPLFHVHGLLGATLSTFHSGGSVVVPARFSASSFWVDQAASGATWYSAVPTIHQFCFSGPMPTERPAGVSGLYVRVPRRSRQPFSPNLRAASTRRCWRRME